MGICTIGVDKTKFGACASEKRQNVQDSNFKCKRFLIYRSFLVLVLVTCSLCVLTLHYSHLYGMIQPHSILTFKKIIESNEFRLHEAQIYNFTVCTWSHHDHDLINSVRFKKEKIRIYESFSKRG